MPSGNTGFKNRVNAAVDRVRAESSIDFLPTRSRSLFSPVLRDDEYEWIKVMDSDGLLVAPRRVVAGEGAAPEKECELLVGVIIQSEDETSQTKPNPLGKAALSHVPNGIWVDVRKEGRRRLDKCCVLMILPKGTTPTRMRKFKTARRNVNNAADMMPDCDVIEVTRGISAAALSTELITMVESRFQGKGRISHN